jgi:hypothetical protein
MTAKKITISVPEDVLQHVTEAIERGDAESISGYFAEAAAARAAADVWVAEDIRRRGPIPESVLAEARRTLLTGELVERRDHSTGRFVRVHAGGE